MSSGGWRNLYRRSVVGSGCCFGRDLWLRGRGSRGDQTHVVLQTPLLVHVDVDHLRGKLGGIRAPVAVLPEDRDDDIRVTAGGHADEPCVRHGPMTAARTGESIVAHDLRGTGLAGEVDPFEVRGRGGARAGGRRGHAVGDDLPVLRAEGHLLCAESSFGKTT
jgi:hypothetical protein